MARVMGGLGWRNLHQHYRIPERSAPAPVVGDLLMTGFDSCFPLLPDGACFTLPGGEPRALILARLGVSIPDAAQEARRRLSSQSLEVEADSSRKTIDLSERCHPWPARTCKVFAEGADTVIAFPDPAETASDAKEIFASRDLRPFSQRWARGLMWIQMVDGEISRSIRANAGTWRQANRLQPWEMRRRSGMGILPG